MEHEERLRAALADRYRIEREIGSGGMATVYIARDLKHERGVAVKVLRPEVASSLGTERFLAEIRLTARLQHPHLVPLFDSGEAGGFLYYVMPYIEGESLRARLERDGQLNLEGMLAIARPVAEALAAAHDLGVVHRDIKPENILLSRGQPFVTDFGIARAVSVAGGERLTATGVSVGTPAYMSPEQVLGEEPVDARSDVYSLGCVVNEMLSGNPPFSGATVQALLARRLTGPPPHLTNVPSPVDEVVRRSLATAPQDRFRTALALADALVEAARRPASPELSIVVLPFENLSPDPDQEFFADGLTEEVISDLSAVRALRVIARTSAMTFKGSRKRAAEIADELNVRYVLEGSVRRAGNSLRITAQLIDAATDTHVWAGKYPGTLEDVFDIQEKVSRAIVDALRIALDPAEERRLKERPIDNVQAYEWFVKAKGEIMDFAPDALHRAQQYLEAAIGITGPNPYLYAGMAFAHLQRANLGVAQEEAIALSDDYVSKALELDPSSPLALTVSGTTEYWFRGNPQEAVSLLKRALVADPNETVALTSLAMAYVNYAGKTAAGRPLVERLRALDPLDGGMLWLIGAVPFFEGDFQQALVEWRRIHKMVPEGPIERFYHALAVSYAGDVEGALDVLGGAEPPRGEDLPSRLCRVLSLALFDDKQGALRELTSEARQTVARDGAWAHLFAAPLAFVGAVDEAIELLEHGVRRGGFINYPMLAHHDPFLAKLRGDPRYDALVEEAKEAWESFEV